MDTGIISGLIGGIVTVLLIPFITSKIRAASTDGNLKYGRGLLVLGWYYLAVVAFATYAFFYDNDAWEKKSELFSIIGLFVGFGAGAIYLFGEYFHVYGSYDNHGIVFHTPWTGDKNEKWSDLKSVKFSSTASWYVLEFKSGKKIRLSSFLGGHGGVLEILSARGMISNGARGWGKKGR